MSMYVVLYGEEKLKWYFIDVGKTKNTTNNVYWHVNITILVSLSSMIVTTQHNLKSCPVYQSQA